MVLESQGIADGPNRLCGDIGSEAGDTQKAGTLGEPFAGVLVVPLLAKPRLASGYPGLPSRSPCELKILPSVGLRLRPSSYVSITGAVSQ
jgi:hypothetical protein